MTFLSLPVLWLLLVIPVLASLYVLGARRRSQTAARFGHLLAASQPKGWFGKFRRHIPPILLLTALTLLIVAMARPAAVITLASQRGTIILAMDVSGSMRASDVHPTRITAAQMAARAFVKDRPPSVQIGIVAFSGGAFLVQAPTTNTSDLTDAIDSLRPERMTAIGSAVLVSLQTIFPGVRFDSMLPGFGGEEFYSGSPLDTSNKPKPPKKYPIVAPGSYHSAAIILMTDGKNTLGPDPVDAARIASNFGVRVFTIGFGTPNGQINMFGDRTMRVVLDEDTLKSMAHITQAQYFHARTEDELAKIYKGLNTQLQKETQLQEITTFFVMGAALLVMASAFLSLLWFGRIV